MEDLNFKNAQVLKEPVNVGIALPEPGPLYIADLVNDPHNTLHVNKFQKVHLFILLFGYNLIVPLGTSS